MNSTQQTTAASHVRLTRRGRVVLLAVLVAVLFATFSLGRSASPPASAAATPWAPSEHVTVQSGESLWTVARRIAPAHDPREVVAELRQVNELSSPVLTPGQQLLVPAGA